MKTSVRLLFLVLVMLVGASQLFAQARRGQFEIYAGANIPLGPEGFKDYYKMGFSLNGQYVFFPSVRVGIPIFAGYEFFSVNSDAINDDFESALRSVFQGSGLELVSSNLDVSGSASIIRFGAGVRPYLTAPEASTQFFLFGNATFNILKSKTELNGGSVTVTDGINTETLELEGGSSEGDESKIGLAIGGGIEIPAGEKINLIFQGLANFIFTSSEEIDLGDGTTEKVGGTTSFVGITAGIIF
ncbi:MAG: hypothetical protein HUU32_12980 [Calditrichaceae bacterium]|nr:hypothetical protein [Calditrichia bacterium]NUQ42302.1 hypothetical protein [Calditrichaceae bacterium]